MWWREGGVGAGEAGGGVKRHPEVGVMTALLGEVTAERHFSWHAECEKHKPKVHIKHSISLYALRHCHTHTRKHTHTHATFQPLIQKVVQTLLETHNENAFGHFFRIRVFKVQKIALTVAFHSFHITFVS